MGKSAKEISNMQLCEDCNEGNVGASKSTKNSEMECENYTIKSVKMGKQEMWS